MKEDICFSKNDVLHVTDDCKFEHSILFQDYRLKKNEFRINQSQLYPV